MNGPLRTQREVARGSGEYPALLEEIDKPPQQLLVTGRRLEPGPALAVVGTRRASRYGLEVAAWVAGELASAGVTIVSGLAVGIDAAAHRGALDAGGLTVAVLGCGLDVCYPSRNLDLYCRIAHSGTLVSEYPDGTRPMPQHFPVRNRIIAGMSLGVVLIEAIPGGGAMITARLAAEFGREVFAIPGPVHSAGAAGPHMMVREGARLATCAEQIMEDLGMPAGTTPAPEPAARHPDEQLVMAVLQAEPLILDLVARRARMPVSTVAAILVRLEMNGMAVRTAGGRYARALRCGNVAEAERPHTRRG